MKKKKRFSGYRSSSSSGINYHEEMMKQMKNDDLFYFTPISEIVENIEPELFCSWYKDEVEKDAGEEH